MANRFRRAILAILIAIGLVAGLQPAPAAAAVQVDISFFHDRLAPYGHWVMHPRYGWVWYPTSVEAGWRPYTHGDWVLTEEYGWYWDSDYAWGWAPFHYGRWAYDDEYGWIWVPGPVWAPAWVVWRSGGGYVGWAPMPPAAVWQEGIGFGGISVDVTFAPAWTFCEERYVAAPRPILVPPARNLTIIKQTTNVTNYVTINNRIVNKSLDIHRIEAAANRRITPVHVRDVDHPAFAKVERGGPDVKVFRPEGRPLPEAASPGRRDMARRAFENPQQRVERLRQERQMERQALTHQPASKRDAKERQRREVQCPDNPAVCEAR
jgi:hypothetical protein